MLNSDFLDEIGGLKNEIETVASWRPNVCQLLLSELRYIYILRDKFLVIAFVGSETEAQRQNELAVFARANIDFIDLIVYSGRFVQFYQI